MRMNDRIGFSKRAVLRRATVVVACAIPALAQAWVLTVNPGPREIFLQVAIYAGVPAAVDSFRIAREAFAELDES